MSDAERRHTETVEDCWCRQESEHDPLDLEILWDAAGETPVQLILGQRRFNLVEE